MVLAAGGGLAAKKFSKEQIMNFASERNKPIFVCRSVPLTNMCSAQMVNEALANSTAIRARSVDDFLVKSAAAKRMPRQVLLTVDAATPEENKELIITRLEADQDEKLQFLDGRTFSGPQAANEVRQGTKVGNYFLELEKETLRILQEAHFRGELG